MEHEAVATPEKKKQAGMGGHQSKRMVTDEWLTPPHIIQSLGVFDLDPCAPAIRPWDTAHKHYCVEDDGLKQEWHGRVWLNPPYGRETGTWLAKLAEHGNGIALVFARTETKMFFSEIWAKADAVLFLSGRLTFHRVDGTKAASDSGAPSALIAYGLENVLRLKQSGLEGSLIYHWHNSRETGDANQL